jgi:hypothetical protein
MSIYTGIFGTWIKHPDILFESTPSGRHHIVPKLGGAVVNIVLAFSDPLHIGIDNTSRIKDKVDVCEESVEEQGSPIEGGCLPGSSKRQMVCHVM